MEFFAKKQGVRVAVDDLVVADPAVQKKHSVVVVVDWCFHVVVYGGEGDPSLARGPRRVGRAGEQFAEIRCRTGVVPVVDTHRTIDVLVQRLVYYAIIVIFLVSALRELGFNLGVLLGAAGIVSVAVLVAQKQQVLKPVLHTPCHHSP